MSSMRYSLPTARHDSVMHCNFIIISLPLQDPSGDGDVSLDP